MILDVVRVPQETAVAVDPIIALQKIGIVRAGPKGLQGDKGWSALVANVVYGQKRVQQIDDWVGGEGDKPDVGDYIGPSGLVPDIDDATDIRGAPGQAATVEVGDVATGSPASPAQVVNVGTSTAAILNFVIPQGLTGDAATIEVGTVTTLPPGSAATVENVGTDNDAILDFGIPKGDAGGITSINGDTGPVVTLDADDIPTTGTTNKFTTAVEISKLANIEPLADVTDAGNVGSSINGATAKTPPVDADALPLIDSAASNTLKKVTWANIKATLKTYFDTLYQPLTAKLTTLAGQTWAADRYTYYTSSTAAAIGTITSFGRSIVAAVDDAAVRTLLALGTLATRNDINNADWNGADLTVNNGGTGVSTLTDGGVMIGNGTGAVQVTTAGTAGQFLGSNGAGVDPSFQNVPGGAISVSSVSNFANDAAVTITLDSTKEQHIFAFQSVVPATDQTVLRILASTNGSTFTVPISMYSPIFDQASINNITSSSVTTGGSVAGEASTLGIGSDTNEAGFSGVVEVHQKSGKYAQIHGRGTYRAGSGRTVNVLIGGQIETTTAVTHIRFNMLSGNLESGTLIYETLEAA